MQLFRFSGIAKLVTLTSVALAIVAGCSGQSGSNSSPINASDSHDAQPSKVRWTGADTGYDSEARK